jgi:hypothetical protein
MQAVTAPTPPLAKRRPNVPVEVLAARTLSLATLGPRRRAERMKESVAELEALAGASLLELRKKLPTRYWAVAMFHLEGKSTREIAAAVGYAGPTPVLKALRHPAVVRLVEEVRREQLERVLRGDYGVAAQAKAAAPAVMEHVAELAGGVKDKATGERRGRARRDADALRAAEITLTVSGDKVARTATTHVYTMLEEFSDAELEALAERGELPERYQGIAGFFGVPTGADLSTPPDASPAAPVDGGARPASEEARLPRARRARVARAHALRGRRQSAS